MLAETGKSEETGTCIFDMSSVNARRYNRTISTMFGRIHCLIDDPDLFQNDNTFLSETCCANWSISKIKKYFAAKNIDKVIISGQRIADHRVTIAAKQSGARVIYKMHGLYVPHMRRDPAFYIQKLQKSFRTLLYCFDIGIHEKSAALIKNLILNFLVGRRRTEIMKFNILQPDLAIYWSAYWKEWHHENYSLSKKISSLIVGNPDTLNIITYDDKNACSYIYQTLVEDGRIAKNIMMQYYVKLKELEKRHDKRIIIKWHPRGEPKIKDELKEMGFEVSNRVTQNSIWIGHYSSLLGLGPLYKNRVVVHELPNHPTPQSISNIADHNMLFDGQKNLETIIDSNNSSKKETAIKYFGGLYRSQDELVAVGLSSNNEY